MLHQEFPFVNSPYQKLLHEDKNEVKIYKAPDIFKRTL